MASVAPQVSRPTARGAERLVTELSAAWKVIAEIGGHVAEVWKQLRQPVERSDSVSETHDQYENWTLPLLVQPVEQFARLRPIRRSLEAMREFDREASSSALRARARIDGRFQALLAGGALDLCEPWRIRRSGGLRAEWLGWERSQRARAQQASGLLAAYQTWAGGVTSKDGTGKKEQVQDAHRLQRAQQWWRQERAVAAMLEMEVAFRDLSLVWLTSAESVIKSLEHEREQIRSVGQKMIEWVREGSAAGTIAPAQSMALVACEERLRVWARSVEQEAAKRLPESVEVVLPGRRTRWRVVRGREAFLSTFATHCEPAIRQSVRDYWEQSATVMREIVRSNEIIDYWRAAATQTEQAETLISEAEDNAVGVLTEQLKTAVKQEKLEPDVVKAFWSWGEEGSTVLEARETGWVELLRKPRGRRLSHLVVREGQRTGRATLHRAGQWTITQWDRVLEIISGKLPAQPMTTPVARRSTLRDTLALPASKRDLPAIYGSLFRLAPIEDRRFLVGRERELGGLEQALKDWDAGRFAACVFVGARGSGKTSLLNCAANSAFSGRELIRSQFSERAITAEAIDDFLRRLLGLEPGDDLEAAFRAKRRILIIEEAERTFLRKVGGFNGALHLLRWIQRTAPTTLWVLAMNDQAFLVLCVGAQFSRVFSHRINAMSVSRVDLENAVLERHRLSGLRLDFAPPPVSDPRVSRVKNWVGLEDSAQKLFFDSLYQQSGGVFRSAFELWLSSIERVEGETLKIRQPLEPAFARFRTELGREDHLMLLIIQEHGSLTYEEAADVLCEDLEDTRERMDRLVALGLIEIDPDHPGFRLRPEALRFTNDTLRRANLN